MRASVMETHAGREEIRTLHVDDDEMFGKLTAEFLESVDSRLDVVTVTSVSAGLSLLEEGGIDCIVSDYDMPGETGIEFLQRVREQHRRLPFILFTGKGSEEVAGEAVSAGVTDYLQKESGIDQYTVLANRIVNATEKYWTETDLERRITQQESLATLGRSALAAVDLATLFDEAVGLVADGLDCAYVNVLEWQPARDEFALRSGVGWQAGLVGTASVPAGADSQAGYTLVSSEPVVVTDVRAETRFSSSDLLIDHGIVSGISVVIGPAEEPWGVLGTHTTSSRSFTSHDVTFVQNVANVLATAIDRHEAQERLRESESRFREIAELSPDGIFRTDVDGVFTYVSPASEAMLGRAADDLVGTPFERVVADGSHEAAREGLDRVSDGAVIRGLALTLVDADGEAFEVEVSASPVRHDGYVEFVQGFARDVTEKNERERELQQSRERFQALVDAFPNGGVFLFDDDLRYTMAGGDELEKGGLTAEAMLGRTASEVFPPENAAPLEAAYRAALEGDEVSFEDTFQGRHYHDQTIPLRNEAGDVIGGMSVAQNITDRVERERELQQSRERYQTLVDNFPGGVFLFDHDLCLSAVGGRELVRMGWDPEELVGELLEAVLPETVFESLEPHYRATLAGESTFFEIEWNDVYYDVQTVPLRDATGSVTAGMAVAQNVTEQREHEQELRQSRERYQTLVDNFPGAVYLFDRECRIVAAGGTALARIGLSPTDIEGLTLNELLPDEDLGPVERIYQAAIEGDSGVTEYEWRGRTYHVQSVPLGGDDAQVAGMTVVHDVTEQREYEQELQESRGRYQTLVDNFPGGVVLFDHDLRVITGGGTEFERADWDPTESRGEPLGDNLTPEGAAYLDTHYRAALDGEARTFEYEASGTHYRLQTLPLRDADGTVTAGMAVTQNVTERVERDRKIDQLRERSQALMHTETDTETAQVAVDAAQEVIDAPLSGYHRLNASGDRLEPGVSATAVSDVFAETPAYDRGAEPGTRAALVWDVFERGEPLYIADVGAYEPLTEPSPSGSVLLYPIGDHGLFVVSSVEPNAYDETDRALVDILAASLTAAMDRVEREQRLRRRERRLETQNERLSRFASLVSHDLRSPLSVARGRVELARRTGDAEHFDAVARAHERMDRLIEDLLQLTIESEDGPTFDSLALGDTATASWGSVDTGNASIVVETTRRVRADENRLRQVFENLFRNAVEHGSTNSRPQSDDSVEHRSMNGEDAGHTPLTVTVGDLPDGFYVEDTGVGIEPERREAVFETGHSGGAGTGLGLHIVRNVADEHGWTVAVTDGRQGGARFEFTGVEIENGTETEQG